MTKRKQIPIVEIYQGQSLSPPGMGGMTAGSAIWLKMNGEWYRIEATSSITKIINSLKRLYTLRKWPWGEGDD